jgi:hypothetical protein
MSIYSIYGRAKNTFKSECPIFCFELTYDLKGKGPQTARPRLRSVPMSSGVMRRQEAGPQAGHHEGAIHSEHQKGAHGHFRS